MKRAQRTANHTNSSFKRAFGGIKGYVAAGFAGVISGLSIGLIVNGVKAALDYAGSLGEVANQLGVTTKDLQVFRYAAGRVGVKQEQLETGLSKLTITLGKVAAGAKAPAQALAAIGVSVDQLKGKDTGEAFRIIADGLKKVTDRSQRAAVEVALFGKSGAMLDNLLAGGSSAINELSAAAEKLGIVLSDEQIRKADETADKLDALKTVLSARVAGVVADNADSILGLANALSDVASAALQATSAVAHFFSEMGKGGKFDISGWGGPSLANAPHIAAGRSVTVPVRTRPKGTYYDPTNFSLSDFQNKPSGGDIPQFLAGGGGSKGKKDHSAEDAKRKAEEARRNAFQFDEELRRGQMDILRARQDLSVSADERADLERQMLDLDRTGLRAELDYRVGEGEITKAQAAQILAQQDTADALRRRAIDADQAARKQHDAAELQQTDYDLKLEALQLESDLADTAAKKRDVELRILDAMEAQERARLEAVLADQQSSDLAKQEAQKRLNALSDTHAARQQGVINSTRGPMEEWQANALNTTDAMEALKVQGIEGAVDALTHLTEGFGSMRDAAVAAIKDIIAQLIRMMIMKAAANIVGSLGGAPSGLGGAAGGAGGFLSSALPGAMSIGNTIPLTGFAKGGGFNVMGNAGVDNNIMSINGLPIAKVSHGERVSISNDNGRSVGGGHSLTQNFYGQVSRETAMQAGVRARQGISQANRKGA